MLELRPDQVPVMAQLRDSLRHNQSVVLRAVCGSGKTVIAAVAMRGTQDKGKRAVFAVHRRELAKQAAATLDRAGVRYTLAMGGERFDASAQCVVAVTDTLAAHPDLMRGVSLYFADEAHLHANGLRSRLIESAKAEGARCVLLTATPLAAGGKTLGHLASAIVNGPSVSSLIASGRLSRFQCYEAVRPDLSGMRGSEYANVELDSRFNKPELLGDAVAAYRRFASGKRHIGYCFNRAHAAAMQASFIAAGIPCGYMDGETPDAERVATIERFADMETPALLNVALCTEGFDLAAQVGRDVTIESCGLYRPTKSVSLAVQMMMRCMRPQSGIATIIDHAGVLVQHGWPDDEREWSLDCAPVKHSEQAPPISTCRVCFAVFRPTAACCPLCGTERERTPKELKQRDAEIAEAVRRDERRQIGKARDRTALEAIARERGYAPGWVKYIMDSRANRGIQTPVNDYMTIKEMKGEPT